MNKLTDIMNAVTSNGMREWTDERVAQAMREFARLVADDALKRAAERATVNQYQHDHGATVDKQSILSTEINLDLAIEKGAEG